jgi:RHS repeat-associated protein
MSKILRILCSLFSGSTWTPYAYVADHRGDVREIVDLGAGTVVERNDYYSYGMRITKPYSSATDFPQLSANRWRLSGKEEQASVTGIGSLDFGARHYDPFVSRWLSPDPLMEKYYGMSPYLYCAGNPVNLVDPDGEDWYRIRGDAGEWEYTYDEDIYDDDSMTAMGITGEYLGATYHDYKANMYMENLSPLVIMAISKMNRLIVLRELFSPL